MKKNVKISLWVICSVLLATGLGVMIWLLVDDDTPRSKIMAHRGLSDSFPENTITSYVEALKAPIMDGIEMDVIQTVDDVLVIIHDQTLRRTAVGPMPGAVIADYDTLVDTDISLLPYSEIQKVNVGTVDSPEYCATLVDVMLLLEIPEYQGKLGFIEVKHQPTVTFKPELYTEALSVLSSPSKITFISFEGDTLMMIKEVLPVYDRIYLKSLPAANFANTDAVVAESIDWVKKTGAVAVQYNAHPGLFTDEFLEKHTSEDVQACFWVDNGGGHAAGLPVGFGDTKEDFEWQRSKRLMYITTNGPKEILELEPEKD